MDESLPLATIHEAILDFARHRDDVVVFGAHAVNAYSDEPRMTQDVDILTREPLAVAEELRAYLADHFNAAIRSRELSVGTAYRIYQLYKPRNRHLADVRGARSLPPSNRVDGVLVPIPAELIAQKIISMVARQGQPKAGSDWRDIATLLLLYPFLKELSGEVLERLEANAASQSALEEWQAIVSKKIVPDNEEY
jgi:hypothetical protein